MKTKLLFSLFLGLTFTISQAQEVWNETTDGDLSDDAANPSGAFTFVQGANTVTAAQQGNPRDVDFFAFIVPAGMELTELNVNNYEGSDDVAFIGIDNGASSDVDFNNPAPGDLLGGATYGTASIGNNILPAMGNLGGATGFSGALPEGTYTIWLNQTGGPSESTLSFVIEETLSIDDNILSENSVTLFPNPAQNSIQIEATQTIERIEIYDVLGKQVAIENNVNTMDVSNFSSGIYLARITTVAGTITKRIVKL